MNPEKSNPHPLHLRARPEEPRERGEPRAENDDCDGDDCERAGDAGVDDAEAGVVVPLAAASLCAAAVAASRARCRARCCASSAASFSFSRVLENKSLLDSIKSRVDTIWCLTVVSSGNSGSSLLQLGICTSTIAVFSS